MVNHSGAYENVIQWWYRLKLWHLHQVEVIKSTEDKCSTLTLCDVVHPKAVEAVIAINIVIAPKQIYLTKNVDVTINLSDVILYRVESIKYVYCVSVPQYDVLYNFVILNKILDEIHIIVDEIIC